MRRLAVRTVAPIAAVLVAVAVALAGCSAGGAGTPSAAGSSTTGTPGLTASASPSASLSDANTEQVCQAVNKAISDGAVAFGNDLGTVIGHLAGGNKAAADKAKADALNQLKALAVKIRAAVQPARDPALTQAATTTANSIAAMAADPKLLSGVRSSSDLGPVIQRLTRATDPMTSVCG